MTNFDILPIFRTYQDKIFNFSNCMPTYDLIMMWEPICKRTHWVSLLIDRNTAVSFDSFGIEYIPQEVLIKVKKITTTTR